MSDPADALSLPIDPQRVRRLFSGRRLLRADDFLQREVSRRMLERLETMRVDASRVLDLGCGSGGDLDALRMRFDGAAICGVDFAGPRLARIASRTKPARLSRLFGRSSAPWLVDADFGALPFASRSIDVLWSNLALHWSPAPHRVLPEWSRVARVGGLVVFSAFGPDTLREVATAFAEVDGSRPVLTFTDMHDYGDMLVASGFATPVVDVERLTLTYPSADSLWRDVRALGGDASSSRSIALRGRDYGRRVARALDRGRDDDGTYRLTFEVIFAHAWKAEPRQTSRGEAIVKLERRR